MGDMDYQSDDILLPARGDVVVRDPSGAGVLVDLQTAFPSTNSAVGRFVSVMADGDDVYILAGPDGTVVADPAAVAGDKQCQFIADKSERPFRVHLDQRYLHCISAKACKVRIAISSFAAPV